MMLTICLRFNLTPSGPTDAPTTASTSFGEYTVYGFSFFKIQLHFV